jgi:hypothetical protein
MEFAADLDRRFVEMHVFTDSGESIVIVCERDSIVAVKRHIERMVSECPEIATWKSARQ